MTCDFNHIFKNHFTAALTLVFHWITGGRCLHSCRCRSWGLKNRSYNSAFYRSLQLLIKRINKDHIIVLCGFTESRRLLGTNPFHHFVFYLLYTIMVCINCCHHILFSFLWVITSSFMALDCSYILIFLKCIYLVWSS